MFNKIGKKLKAIVLIGVLVVSFSPISNAYDAQREYSIYDPMSWAQGRDPGSEKNLGIGPDDGSFGRYSCAIHSLTAMYVKYGARQHGYVPIDYRDEAIKIINQGKPSHAGITHGGLLNWVGAATQSNGYFEFVDVKSGNGFSLSELKNWVNKGYSLVLNVPGTSGWNGHYVLLDEITDEAIHIVDSGGARTRMSHYKGAVGLGENKIGRIIIYKPLKNVDVKPLHQRSIQEMTSNSIQPGSTSSTNGSTGSVPAGSFQLNLEELEGVLKQEAIGTVQVQTELADDNSLDAIARAEVNELNKAVQIQKQANKIDYSNIIISLVGGLMIMLGVSFSALWAVDLYFSVPLFEIIFKKKPSFDGKNGTFSLAHTLMTSLALIAVGVLTVLGVIPDLLGKFIELF